MVDKHQVAKTSLMDYWSSSKSIKENYTVLLMELLVFWTIKLSKSLRNVFIVLEIKEDSSFLEDLRIN